MNTLAITGNTYPVKDKLRALGCTWNPAKKAWLAPTQEIADKAKAIVPAFPIYNSPPPRDLGSVDPVEAAKKFGREVIEGSKILSFRGSDEAEADGSIHKIEGVRYVQLAHAKAQYFSRDYLEDMDMFDLDPGRYHQWDGVAVKPTEDELSSEASAKAAAAAKDAPRVEALALVKATEKFASQYDKGMEALPESVQAIKISLNSYSAGSSASTDEGTVMTGEEGAEVAYYHGGHYDAYRTVIRLGDDQGLADEVRAYALAIKDGDYPQNGSVLKVRIYKRA